MKEILVHISAPTSRKDDDSYRRLAEAYDEFESVTTIHCTGEDDHQVSKVNASENLTTGPARDVVPGTPANLQAFSGRASHHGVTEEGSSPRRVEQTPRVQETPTAAGFVEPAQIVPASRTPAVKGKRLELYAQAPDFGSFTSTATTSSRTPIQQLHELERRFLRQQRSSVKRSASGVQKGSIPARVSQPLYVEDTQEALAALEDHIESSSFGSWPSSSPAESPITQRSSKRRRLSVDTESPDVRRGSQHAEVPAVDTLISSTWVPPPRTPPRDSMSSQMPDDYNCSTSQSSSLRTSENSGPIFSRDFGLDGSQDTVFHAQNTSDPALRPYTGQAQAYETGKEGSRHSQASAQDVPELSQAESSDCRHQRPSQDSTQDRSESLQAVKDQPAARNDESYATSMTEQTIDKSAIIPSKPVPQPQDLDFASLPLQLLPKPPATEKKQEFDEVTWMLQRYVDKASIAKHYKPASVSRAIAAAERGCWMFDTSTWEPRRQYEFWTRMQYLLGEGYFGNVWLQRNVANDWKRGGSDGNEAKGLGVVWVFCWGQVVAHIWIVLLVESHLQIRKSKARWTVGPMERLEVVVQMP